ncbi:MAG: hypothetical protein GXO48_08800 [Chlorobi bacterium]|nr:hypothetical protein [Chlorobiota bacterium]
MPLVPTLEINKKLNSAQAISFSIGYSLPVNIGSETKYAFLYRINALFVSAGINQAILSKNRIRINVSMLGIGRVGSVRWNTDVYSYLPPPPEFEKQSLMAIGLMALEWVSEQVSCGSCLQAGELE